MIYNLPQAKKLVLPVKGDIVKMDLNGNGDKEYRVIKISDNVAQVMAMYSETTLAWDSRYSDTTMGTLTVAKYEDSEIDTFLNTSWYNTLTITVKAAIVPENVVCDAWYYGDNGDPDYTGTSGTTVPGTNSYTISKYTGGTLSIGNRNVFVLGIQDVIDYLNDSNVQVDTTTILCNVNIWKMFWDEGTQQPTNYTFPWLRSAYANRSSNVWCVNGQIGRLDYTGMANSYDVWPALNLDLSKVPFTISN